MNDAYKVSIKHTTLGITFSIGPDVDKPPVKDLNADQLKPRRFYVYAHIDCNGKIFYIGKGTERRAWSRDRLDLWHKYVSERSNGKFTIEILHDDLTAEQAEELESQWISLYGEQLVNWDNPGRQLDYEALDRFHKLRNANRTFVAETRPLETSAPDEAVRRYKIALDRLREYEAMTLERGLVPELMGPEKFGDNSILDRLTICLMNLGRQTEAQQITKDYFSYFVDARQQASAERIIKRISKSNRRDGTNFPRRQKQIVPIKLDSVFTFPLFPKCPKEKSGCINGKHFTNYVDEVKQLKRDGKLEEAEQLLLQLLSVIEEEKRGTSCNVLPSWYYEQLAILFSKKSNYAGELAVLERYEKGCDPGRRHISMIKRLAKLRARIGAA